MTTDLLGRHKRSPSNVNVNPPKVTPITVICDSREQRPWQFSGSVTVERHKLDAGDYSLAGYTDRVAIERKSIDDLAQTISWGRDRFCDEIRLLKEFEFRCIIVEASIDDIVAHRYESRTHPSAIIGSTIAFFVDAGLPTIFAGNAARAANMAERIMRRIYEKGMFGK